MLKAPIPGMSLTTPPGNYPWEQPPQMENPEEALRYHIKRINDPERIDAIIDVLELGMPVKAITEGMLTSAVSQGRHSIDVSILIAPVIHEQIKNLAEDAGIEYDEGMEDPNARTEEESAEMLKMKVRTALKKQKTPEGKELFKQTAEFLEKPMEEEAMPVSEEAMPVSEELNDVAMQDTAEPEQTGAAPRGLMARKV